MIRVSGRQPSGFSVVELMVVIGISGLMIATTVPAVSGLLRSSRLAGAANTLVADLHHARALATEERTTFAIEFSADSYSLVRVSPRAAITDRELPSEVACAASDTATFFAWGLTTPITITMNNPSGSRTIQLAANGNVTRE